jgi:hypothetical protein
MRKAILVLALIVLGATSAKTSAQTLSTATVQVNQGAPARAIFVFGAIPGATELVVQCDIGGGRAWIIENFDVYGEQASTGFFSVTCTVPGPNPYVTPTYSVAPTSADVTLYHSDGTTTSVTVTITSASWQSTRSGCGRSGTPCYKNGTGAAMITIATN